jgi:hypothetical protein
MQNEQLANGRLVFREGLNVGFYFLQGNQGICPDTLFQFGAACDIGRVDDSV